MQSQDFVCLVTLDAFGAGIPGEDVTVRIEQINGVLGDTFEDGPKAKVVLPQGLLRGALLGNVADEAHHRQTVFGLHRLEHDVDRELRAILAQAEEIHRRAHLPGAGVSAVVFAMAGMAAAEARGNEHLDVLTEKLLGGVAELLPCTRVRGADYPVSVRNEDRVRRELEEALDDVLGKALRDALFSICGPPRGIQGTHVVLPTLAERYR